MTGRPWSRAEYVEFVRTHHPDVGGDGEVFRAGLAEFRAARQGAARDSGGIDGREQDEDYEDDERFDGPVEVVVRPPLARRLWARARQRHGRQRQIRVD